MSGSSGKLAVGVGLATATIPTVLLFLAITYLFVVPLFVGFLCVVLGSFNILSDGKFMRHVGWVAAVLCFLAVAVPFGVIADSRSSGYPVVMVVPVGFKGPVTFLIDRENGVEVPREEGRYTYRIPQNGTLVIKDDRPLRRWHSTTAFYSDGTTLPISYDGNHLAGSVALRFLGAGSKTQGGTKEEFIENFVGTEDEMRNYVDGQR